MRAVLWYVEVEIQLVHKRLVHPEWFVRRSDDFPLVIWRSGNAKMEIAEMALGICLAKVLWTPGGMLMEYSDIIRLAEQIFGIKLSNHAELKRDVLKRKKDLVVFLNRLIFLIEQARDEKDA